MTTPKPVVLIVMDGWGFNPGDPFNAVEKARTPSFDKLWEAWPHTTLKCMGQDVGLPDGVMGNSEVGHLNLGAGRIVWQDIARIDNTIEDKTFFNNEALLGAVRHAKENNSALHLAGLLGTGNVHASERHYLALLELAKQEGLPGDRVFFHAFTDGRDTAPTSAQGFMQTLEGTMQETGMGCVATVCGRFYAMDRDNNWNLVEEAYRCLVEGKGQLAASAQEALQKYYDNPTDARSKVGDEFILPTVVSPDGDASFGRIKDGDALIFFNYRTDRGRELSHVLLDESFPHFDRGEAPKLHYVTMTQYEKGLPVTAVAFPPQQLDNVLARVVADADRTQFHTAETQKYPHVTFFFNGGLEPPVTGEDRLLVPSLKEVTFDRWPAMSAGGIMDGVLQAIYGRPVIGAQYFDENVSSEGCTYDLIVVNFANGDMVGHTGDFDAAVRAIEAVDDAVGTIVNALEEVGGAAIVTADHGNSDDMWDEENDCRHTAHSLNPVPAVLYGAAFKDASLRNDGRLADVAPTLLAMMGLEKPAEMDGSSLIV